MVTLTIFHGGLLQNSLLLQLYTVSELAKIYGYLNRGFLWLYFLKSLSNFVPLGFPVRAFILFDMSVYCGCRCAHLRALGVRAPSVSCPITSAILPVFTHLPPPALPALPSTVPCNPEAQCLAATLTTH